ncbi:MAG: hypothetical protein U0359_02760 [Byssovorax sp.]
MTPSRSIAALACLAALTPLTSACSKTPSEPEPSAAVSAAPALAPLVWDAPGTWTVLTVPKNVPKKASYQIEKAGNDKEGGEAHVFFLGTGEKGNVEKGFKEWFDQFDGDAAKIAKRETFTTSHGMTVETVEVAGTYKVPLSPPVGPQKKAAMQMVKENYRLYGAVVKTPDRGNWFFKLTGPDETVQSAKSAFRTMLESAR